MTVLAFQLKSWIMALVLVVLPLQAVWAAASEKEMLREYVRDNTLTLVDRLDDIRTLYGEDREGFYTKMDEALGEFVAFRRVAARVMGRYARQTTREERDEFVHAFRRSLYDAYGGAAASVSSSDFELRVEEVAINPRDSDRATANLKIITHEGDRYGIAYSMYRSDDDRWLVENIIVEGVNIGLAFRDHFNQQIRKYDGDVQKVISNWSVEDEDLRGIENTLRDEGNADAE